MELRERAEIVIERKLIESQGFYQYSAGAVRHTDEIEISLEDAVFSGGAVDGDVSKVEGATLVLMDVGEIVEIHGNLLVFDENVHCVATLFDDVAIIFFSIHKRKDACCAAQRNVVFGGVASSDNSDVLLHCDI